MSRGFSPLDVTPNVAQTQGELTALGQQQDAMSFTNTIGNLFQTRAIGDAQSLYSPVAMAVRMVQRDSFDADPNFRLTTDRLEQLVQDVDPKYWDMFEEATSEDQANLIRSQAMDLTATERRLAEDGAGGMVAGVVASIFDPTALAAGMVTAGLSYGGMAANTTVQAARAARLSRLARAGVINGLPQGLIDAYSASESPDLDTGDVLAGFAGGFTFGAFLANQGLRDATALVNKSKLGSKIGVAAGGAAAQAVPTMAVDAAFHDRNATETTGMFMLNMALGAGFSTIARQSEMGRAIGDYARKSMLDIDARALAEEGLNPGYVAPEGSKQVVAAIAGFDDVSQMGGLPVIAPPTAAATAIRQGILADTMGNPAINRLGGTPIVPTGQPQISPKYRQGLLDLSQVSDEKMNTTGRVDPASWIHRDGTSIERFIANAVAADPVGASGSRTIASATWADQRARGEQAAFESQAERIRGLLNQELEKSGQPTLGVDAWQDLVGKAVIQALNDPTALTRLPVSDFQRFDSSPQVRGAITSKHIQDAAKLVLEHNAKTASTLRDMGVKGIPDDAYYPILWDNGKMTQFRQQSSRDERRLRETFANGVEKMMDKAPLESLFPTLEAADRLKARARVAEAIGNQIIKNGGTQNNLDAATQHSLLTLDQYNELAARLKRDIPGANTDYIKSLLFNVNPIEGEDAAASFLRAKIPMDYTYRTVFEDGTSLAPADFLNTSAYAGTRAYTRRAYGVAAASELGRVMKDTYGLESQPRRMADFLALADRAMKEEGKADPGRLLQLEHLLKQVYGLPIEYSVFGQGENVALYQSSTRLFRASVRAALLTNPIAAVGQAQEFAGVIAQNGAGALRAAAPWAWELRKTLLEGGKIDSGLMRMAVENGFASGTMLDNIVANQMTEDFQLVNRGANRRERLGAIADRAAMWLSEKQPQLSGERFIRNLQEGTTFYAGAEFLHDIAKGRKTASVTDKELLQWGVTRSEYDHVLGQLKKHGTDTNAGYHEPNLDKWKDALQGEDLAGTAAYERILVREARLAVQAGESTLIPRSWFSTEGKIATQLMPYAYSAYYQRLLPALKRHDVRTAGMIFSSITAGALAYLVNTYMQSIGREDRKEFLEKRLETKKFVMNSLARSSFMSLIPRFADAAAAGAGYDAPFSGSRLSGLGQDGGFIGALAGNPSLDRLQKIIGATKGVIRAPLDSDYDWSKRDTRNLLGALGVPNWMGTHSVFMQLGNQPDRPN